MSSDNSFEAPVVAAAGLDTEDAVLGVGKLYSRGGVLWASFFGTFLGGAFVMSLNYRRLKMPQQAQKTMFFGVLATIAFIVLVAVLPDRIPNAVYTVATLVPMHYAYQRHQAELFARHLKRKGSRGSNWACVGFGLVCAIVVAVVVFGGAMVLYGAGIIKD